MNDKADKMKKIPYGVADYEKILLEHYYYIDKTPYLPVVEEAGDYLFFIRPRRFGKSLFLSTMETYYDILKKDQFDLFYKGTYIHQHPTGEKNKYLILKFNFSAVDPRHQFIESSFLNNVRVITDSFLFKYTAQLAEPHREKLQERLDEIGSAADILLNVTRLCKISQQKIYIIIDEYDNFANTILSTTGSEAYENLTRGEGFFRVFFNVLKDGTSGSGAPISRLFITGVSPITMDDVTSGFNIGKNVSLLPRFNPMLGFTENDVIEIIEYYRQKGMIQHDTRYMLKIMTAWYGNYCFSEDDNTKLYNPDMVLYFVDNYLMEKKLPKDLIDRNVSVDYGKLRHLILIDKGDIGRGDGNKCTNGNFHRLKEIIQNGQTSSELVKGFPLEQLTDTNNFTSLLFYFGLLTIRGPERDKLLLTIPNETVKRLYYSYIHEAYRETHIFDIDLSRYADLMTGMAYDGQWEPLIDFITSRMRESMSLRDLITGEKSIQAFLNVYLGLSQLYIIHAEKELDKGYADIVMEPFLARYEGMKYSYLLEIKYLNAGIKPVDSRVQQLRTKAGDQLKHYSIDKKFKKTIGKTTLIKLVLVFSGHELIYLGKVV